jgi:hypothetical protein
MKLTTSPSGHHDTRYAVVKCRLIEAKQTSLGRGAEAEVLRDSVPCRTNPPPGRDGFIHRLWH